MTDRSEAVAASDNDPVEVVAVYERQGDRAALHRMIAAALPPFDAEGNAAADVAEGIVDAYLSTPSPSEPSPRMRVTGDYDVVWEDANGNPSEPSPAICPNAECGSDQYWVRYHGCRDPWHFVAASEPSPERDKAEFGPYWMRSGRHG